MEAFSVTASVVGLIDMCFHLSHDLRQFAQAQDAGGQRERVLDELSVDILSLGQVLETLSSAIQDYGPQLFGNSTQLDVQRIIEGTSKDLSNLRRGLSGFPKEGRQPENRILLKWSFTQKRFEEIRERLNRTKASLVLLIQVVQIRMTYD